MGFSRTLAQRELTSNATRSVRGVRFVYFFSFRFRSFSGSICGVNKSIIRTSVNNPVLYCFA